MKYNVGDVLVDEVGDYAQVMEEPNTIKWIMIEGRDARARNAYSYLLSPSPRKLRKVSTLEQILYGVADLVE